MVTLALDLEGRVSWVQNNHSFSRGGKEMEEGMDADE